MSKTERITPRTLKGFRDYLPETMIPRERLMDTAKQVYRSFGFAPIETPALEYLEILTGKGSDETDKQLYRFQDHGGRDVGLRFDLTVPLARFAAQHAQGLGLPFKRYHIGTVWRGENTQRGRYREFMQCDFDTIGTTSVASDIETVLVVATLLRAIGFERFTIRVNHRGILNGLLEKSGLADKSTEVLRALDKLAKQGEEKVRAELAETAEANPEQIDQLMAFASIQGENESILGSVSSLIEGNETGQAAVERLRTVLSGLAASGVDQKVIQLDPSIARGLDYYTGIVLETTLNDLPEIGSVASGGRYDNLADLYTKQELPGIGASLGLDRLLAAMESLNMLPEAKTPADVLVAFFAEDRLEEYLRIASQLRQAGIRTELYPEAKKLGKQLQYADKKGFRVALIAGDEELANNSCQLKNLSNGESVTVSLEEDELVCSLNELLGN